MVGAGAGAEVAEEEGSSCAIPAAAGGIHSGIAKTIAEKTIAESKNPLTIVLKLFMLLLSLSLSHLVETHGLGRKWGASGGQKLAAQSKCSPVAGQVKDLAVPD